MNNERSFAFKLAGKSTRLQPSAGKWRAREGVSVAGCSRTFDEFDNWRTSPEFQPQDSGIYC